MLRAQLAIEKLAPPPIPAASPLAPATSAPASPRTVAPTAVQNPARPAPATHPPAQPASGRVIWIGRLQKNQTLIIKGKNCSTGTLVGELPSRPIKFSLSPGDLSSDGIVLYTSNSQYANNVVEPPGAGNGWNKTVYTWNPKFASDVAVEETPSAQNGWSGVLRGKNPKISVIVIDWALVN
jgi:phosphatidylserine decarboxylase